MVETLPHRDSKTASPQQRCLDARRAVGYRCAFAFGSALASALILALSQHCSADPRQVFDADSPAWLQAVGKLTVPGYRYKNGDRRHHEQHCTATLVSEDIVLSGWHCLEHYSDLSLNIVFTLPSAAANTSRIARRVADGGGMHADWALLKLDKPVRTEVAAAVAVSAINEAKPGTQGLTLAGYSRDKVMGKTGRRLTYHANCEILDNESYRVATNCVAFRGSSGGPVVYDRAIIGVVSAGDSERLSYFTPSRSFSSAVKRYLD